MDEIPMATDPDVERIASRLFDYITTENAFPRSLKVMLCEALYEMQSVTRGQRPHPVITGI